MKRTTLATVAVLLAQLAIDTSAVADIRLECPKTFTMSSKAGIAEQYNGTDYIKYVEGKFICDLKSPDSDDCYFKYQDIIEGRGAVVGFLRQEDYPKDTQVIVLDLRNRKFYKTVEQGDLRFTVFGDCQEIDANRLKTTTTVKDDAFLLLGASLLPPGIAEYCHQYVLQNDALLKATKEWKERHDKIMKKAIHVIKREGGLSDEQKELLKKFTNITIKNEVEHAEDRLAYCNDVVRILNSGELDFDKREDTKAAAERISGESN